MNNGRKNYFPEKPAPVQNTNNQGLPKKNSQYLNNCNSNSQAKVASIAVPSAFGSPFGRSPPGELPPRVEKNKSLNDWRSHYLLMASNNMEFKAMPIPIKDGKEFQRTPTQASRVQPSTSMGRTGASCSNDNVQFKSRNGRSTLACPNTDCQRMKSMSDYYMEKILAPKVQSNALGINNDKCNNNNSVPSNCAKCGRNSLSPNFNEKSLPTDKKKQPSTSKAVTVKHTEDNNDLLPYRDIYYKMISMFPNTDPRYIKLMCAGTKGATPEEALNRVTDQLLISAEAHPQRDKKVIETKKILTPEEQYKDLREIFPNADPNYLKKFVEKNHMNPDVISEFVQRNLEQQDYPTMQQYLENQKMTEQQKQYTEGFSVEQFLEVIPDPVKYFEDNNRKQAFDAVVLAFLKSRYSMIKIATIESLYRENNYHFTKTAKALDNVGCDMQRMRKPPTNVPVPRIPLLQEMAYVTHRKEILKYIDVKKSMEEKEFQKLKKKNMLLECQCCFDAECLPSKCDICENGHIFCHSCIQKGTEATIANGESHIKCFVNCGAEFSVAALQKALPPTNFSHILRKWQEAEVTAAGLEGLVSCPFCPFASIPPPGDKIFKCLNPDCMKESCRNCKKLNHVPLRCDEIVKKDKARIYVEEKMTQALLRTCYNCKKQFFKEDGCNKMTCICGATMCYICDKPVKDYSHFSGQGSDRKDLCPLYTDDKRLNAEIVRREAELAALEIQQKDPHVKIDTKNLLPAVPPKSYGPHENVPTIDVVAKRIARRKP